MPSIPFSPPRFSALPPCSLTKRLTSTPTRFASTGSSVRFDWSDALRFGSIYDDEPLDLSGFFQRVSVCNRGSEKKDEFMPFLIDNQIAGYTHKAFTEHLSKHNDVFSIVKDKNGIGKIGEHLRFNPSLKTYEARTEAVAHVIKSLGNLIPGIRNELYPVTLAFGVPPFFSLERAAAPYFGIKAYGVHMNGYVEIDGEKFLWVAKRSEDKPTFPGMLDHIVAGGLPHGISCKKNIIKECEEEAGIPASISTNVIPVGAVSYMDIEGYRYKRDVLFCYDLNLPPDFVPKNEDGEVDSFRLITVSQAANIIRRTEFYKPNCCLVILDFLFRHGYIDPDCEGYLQLLQSLRSSDCT
ncbi:nudix hydrolase 20, chloroplastic-like [Carex rostrata]